MLFPCSFPCVRQVFDHNRQNPVFPGFEVEKCVRRAVANGGQVAGWNEVKRPIPIDGVAHQLISWQGRAAGRELASGRRQDRGRRPEGQGAAIRRVEARERGLTPENRAFLVELVVRWHGHVRRRWRESPLQAWMMRDSLRFGCDDKMSVRWSGDLNQRTWKLMNMKCPAWFEKSPAE